MGIINKLSEFFAPVDTTEYVVTESVEPARDEEPVQASTPPGGSQKAVGAGEPPATPFPASINVDANNRRQSMKLVANNKPQEMRIQIYTPQNFDNVSEIADALKAKRSAIVNYERVDIPEQRRICDFLNGVCYVQDGEVRRITETMVLYVPSGVEIREAKPMTTDASAGMGMGMGMGMGGMPRF